MPHFDYYARWALLPAPGGPMRIILTLSCDGDCPPWPDSLFSSSAMRCSRRLTVLLRSSTTVSVMGAIAPDCEENCGGEVWRDGERNSKMRGPLRMKYRESRNGNGQSQVWVRWSSRSLARRSVVGRSKLLYGKMLPSARSSVPSRR